MNWTVFLISQMEIIIWKTAFWATPVWNEYCAYDYATVTVITLTQHNKTIQNYTEFATQQNSLNYIFN